MHGIVLVIAACCLGAIPAVAAPAAEPPVETMVIALERAALDRWGAGDPGGFLEVYAPEITYFDVATPQRLDGHAALTAYYAPFAGRIKVSRYEMIAPRVQHHGDTAVLTYNLRSDAVQPDGSTVVLHWNSTAVYARAAGRWRMIHSHWSMTAPACLRGTV